MVVIGLKILQYALLEQRQESEVMILKKNKFIYLLIIARTILILNELRAIDTIKYSGGSDDGYCSYITSKNVVLSVSLLSFTATQKDENIVIKWVTLSETKNSGFHIYRSFENSLSYIQISHNIISGGGTTTSRRYYEYIDKNITKTGTWYYKLAEIDFNGKRELFNPISIYFLKPLNKKIHIIGNSPNPFNNHTQIFYQLAEPGEIFLEIYNTNGQLIEILFNNYQPAGSFQIVWNGQNKLNQFVATGIYIIYLRTKTYMDKKKILLIR